MKPRDDSMEVDSFVNGKKGEATSHVCKVRIKNCQLKTILRNAGKVIRTPTDSDRLRGSDMLYSTFQSISKTVSYSNLVNFSFHCHKCKFKSQTEVEMKEHLYEEHDYSQKKIPADATHFE